MHHSQRAFSPSSQSLSTACAYDTLVAQRIVELRGKALPGTQTLGEFMPCRRSPAIATEVQNQLLPEKPTRGQKLQRRLQATVEGLLITAISYDVISLLLYAGKTLKAAGSSLNPEIAAVGHAHPTTPHDLSRTVFQAGRAPT